MDRHVPGMATLRSAIENGVIDFCSINMPKEVVIQNVRLGALYRVLQFLTLMMVLAYIFDRQSTQEIYVPQPRGNTVWLEAPANAALVQNKNVLHCSDPRRYWYNFSATWTYQPSGCHSLSGRDQYRMLDPSKMLVSTYIQRTHVWTAAAELCGEVGRQLCSANVTAGGKFQSTPNGGCSCTVYENYFAQNPEEFNIWLIYGFEVDVSTERDGSTVIWGSSSANSLSEGFLGDMRTLPDNLLTVIRSPQGEPCAVGGLEEWDQEVSHHGVWGSLKDWMACAGTSLDGDPRAFLDSSSFAPNFRTMGLALELDIFCSNTHGRQNKYSVVCTVTPHVTPVWTELTFSDFEKLPLFGGKETVLRETMIYGVMVSVTMQGKWQKFSFGLFVNTFVNSLVVLSLPFFVVQFILLRCLGFLSEIYNEAKRSVLNISENFYSTLARMMVAETGFRGLMGGTWGESMTRIPCLTEGQLFTHLCDVFKDEIKSGVLQMPEMKRMALATYTYLDHRKSGGVTCSEFIRACTADENISVKNAARFFDEDYRVHPIQRFLDSGYKARDHVFQIDLSALKGGSMVMESQWESGDFLTDVAQEPRPSSFSDHEHSGNQRTNQSILEDHPALDAQHRSSCDRTDLESERVPRQRQWLESKSVPSRRVADDDTAGSRGSAAPSNLIGVLEACALQAERLQQLEQRLVALEECLANRAKADEDRGVAHLTLRVRCLEDRMALVQESVSQQSLKLEGAANESFEMRLTPRSASEASRRGMSRTEHETDSVREVVDARTAVLSASTTKPATPAVAHAPRRFGAMFGPSSRTSSSRSTKTEVPACKQNVERSYSTRMENTNQEIFDVDSAVPSEGASQVSDCFAPTSRYVDIRSVEPPWKPVTESLASVARSAEVASTRSRTPGAMTPLGTPHAPPEGRPTPQFAARGGSEGHSRSPRPNRSALDHELDALDWRTGKHNQSPERQGPVAWDVLAPVTLGPVKIWHPFSGQVSGHPDLEDSSIFASF